MKRSTKLDVHRRFVPFRAFFLFFGLKTLDRPLRSVRLPGTVLAPTGHLERKADHGDVLSSHHIVLSYHLVVSLDNVVTPAFTAVGSARLVRESQMALLMAAVKGILRDGDNNRSQLLASRRPQKWGSGCQA